MAKKKPKQKERTFDEIVGSDEMIHEVRHRAVEPAQIKRWCDEASDYAEHLVSGEMSGTTATRAIVSMFWIRLYGVLVDVPDFFNGRIPHTLLAAAQDAITTVRTALDGNQLAYLEYRRAFDAHPVQDAFAPLAVGGSVLFPGQLRKNAMKQGLALLLFYRQRISWPHLAEAALARDTATKIAPALRGLRDAVDAWHAWAGNAVQIKVPAPRKK